MDVQQLQNFLVLCNTLNFRKAAEQINIVQPALSRQIQLLEEETGALLFNRSKRAVTLTEAGTFFQKEMNVEECVRTNLVSSTKAGNGPD